MTRLFSVLSFSIAITCSAAAAEREIRPIPAPGVAVPDKDRTELDAEVARLRERITALRTELKSKPHLLRLLPDVEIFHKAVRYALDHNEFYNVTNEIPAARSLLKLGFERAAQLTDGRAPWLSATGLVVRSYTSRIDGSVQPYGLVVPANFSKNNPHRLDFWFHGRDEKLTELSFLSQRLRSPGEFVPPNTIVLHPYGRYCNANKFAGEIDLFEALDHLRQDYNIDENRIAVRGFSMGGAACWQFAVHYADRWAAAAPGAGFAETARFSNFARSPFRPPWYHTNLWHLYDATDYAANLFNCPVVAYSGEIDRQKQAADVMAEALQAEGIELAHVIGPGTAHRYHPDSKVEINRRIDAIMSRGREQVPRRVRFTTWTLRYNRMHWITVDALEQHWQRARVNAEWDATGNAIRITTTNVAALTLEFPAGSWPLDIAQKPSLMIDGQRIDAPRPLSDRSFTAHFVRNGSAWTTVPRAQYVDRSSLRKHHGLQGPIDDAFMDSFLMVRPSGTPFTDQIGKWAVAEFTRATNEWRRQFRAEVRVKTDAEVTESDIAEHNLVLWGDPASNHLLARIAEKLPLSWKAEEITLGGRKFPGGSHVPILIFPNPLNPNRYIVLNSGVTFREAHYLSNALQVPQLPDYAIIDLSEPPNPYTPGKVAAAGFFDEYWALTDTARGN